MKKKKLRNALLCALAVPCMFGITACGETPDKEISAREYNNLVFEAGKNYLANHTDYKTFGDMTTTFTGTSTTVDKEEVTYKATAEATETTTKEFDVTTTTTRSQTIEINRDETENGDISVRVTYKRLDKTKRKQANAETKLLEDYEESEDTTTIKTFIKEGESYKFYEHSKTISKETGVEDETVETKEVYTFASREEYQSAIDNIIDDVNNNQVTGMLTTSEEILFLNPDIYKDGSNFGYDFEYGGVGLDGGDELMKNNMAMSTDFKNNLPYKTSAEMSGYSISGESNNFKQEITVTYSAPAITAPVGATDYENNDSLSYDFYVESIGF